MIASVKPFSPKFMNSKLNVVTIVSTPKSPGARIRASTTVPTIWTTKPNPCENTVTPAARTANLETLTPPEVEQKSPLRSNGFMSGRTFQRWGHGDGKNERKPDDVKALER